MIRILLQFICLLILVMGSMPAHGQNPMADLLKQLTPGCRGDVSTADVTQCELQKYNEAELSLDSTYKRLLVQWQSRPSEAKSLERSQTKWISERDKSCYQVWNEGKGGSMQAFDYLECMTVRTVDRRQFLMKSYK